MAEVITLQVGQCGNQLGNEFWLQLCDIHGVSPDGSVDNPQKSLEVHFEAVSRPRSERFVPRCILIDTKPFDALPEIFSPDNIVCGLYCSGNNWAKGFYNEGFDLIDHVMDATRQAAERTDSLQGVQVFQSLGGGTGSGLGSLIFLIDWWMNGQILAQAFDNAAVYNIYAHGHRHHHNHEGLTDDENPLTFGNLNTLIARAICSVACSYSGSFDRDRVSLGLRKLATNLIPFPRLHFLTVSNAPHVPVHHEAYRMYSDQEMLRESIKASNYMISGYSTVSGLHLTNAILLLGNLNQLSVEHELRMMVQHHQHRFARWIPDQACFSHSYFQHRHQPSKLTMLSNNTGIRHAFHDILDQFTVMFRRKSFLWRYYSEGAEEMEFTCAQADLEDLLDEYQHFEQFEEVMEAQWSKDSLDVEKEERVVVGKETPRQQHKKMA